MSKTLARNFRRVWKQYIGFCAYCGGRGKLTIEHVIPRSRGGADHPTNFLCVCKSCNEARRDKCLHDWIAGSALRFPDRQPWITRVGLARIKDEQVTWLPEDFAILFGDAKLLRRAVIRGFREEAA